MTTSVDSALPRTLVSRARTGRARREHGSCAGYRRKSYAIPQLSANRNRVARALAAEPLHSRFKAPQPRHHVVQFAQHRIDGLQLLLFKFSDLGYLRREETLGNRADNERKKADANQPHHNRD